MQIAIDRLSKTYPGGVPALRDVTLNIGVGMFGLLGPNGAGKTTLMRILCTLLEPSSGRITIGNVDRVANPQRVRELIGYLPQEFGFFRRLTAYEYLDFAAGMKGVPARERRRRIPDLLERVNLSEESHRPVASFSGGMKRRLGLAQALVGDPRVLVVDEPTAGLDPEERLRIRNLLAELSVDRIVLLSTHIVADVESACSQLAILYKGWVRFSGNPGALIERAQGHVWQLEVSAVEFVRLQRALKIISSRRTGDGMSLRVLSPVNPLERGAPVPATLEDGYLALMGTLTGLGTGEESA